MTPTVVKFLIGLSLLLVSLHGLSAQKVTLNPKGCGVSFHNTMIVNGTEVKETQYPWMVFLELQYADAARACGGTIITERHVLTAAHCLVLDNIYVQKVVVTYGSVDRRNGKKVEASKMMIHKGYHMTKHVNDIALLEVKYAFQFSKEVTRICLPMTRVPLVNKNAIVSGWGSLYYGGQGVDFLRQTTVSIYPSIICSLLYSRLDYSDVYQCCANRVGKGACKGDSGGPLMLRTGTGRFQQVGIVSYGAGTCGGIFNPQVYTRVDGYVDWLTRGVSSSASYKPLGEQKTYMLWGRPYFIA